MKRTRILWDAVIFWSVYLLAVSYVLWHLLRWGVNQMLEVV